MATTKMTKEIKAFAVFDTGGLQVTGERGHHRASVFLKRQLAEAVAKVAPSSWRVVPVVISFSVKK